MRNYTYISGGKFELVDKPKPVIMQKLNLHSVKLNEHWFKMTNAHFLCYTE